MKADRKILAIAIKHFDSIKKRGDLKSHSELCARRAGR